MEQSSGKKERLMLAAGLGAALALAAAQYFFPVSRALWSGRDVNLAVLGERGSALLVYHPASATVDAFTLAQPRPRRDLSGRQRATALFSLAGGTTAQAEIFYVMVSSAPDLDVLRDALNGWRADPRRFFSAAAWVGGLRDSGATDMYSFDLFRLFSDFSGLGFSSFSTSELSRQARAPEVPGPSAAEHGPAPRVEVFNASGRKDMAASAAKRLRALGFDVITAASYHKIEKNTRILCFPGGNAAAHGLRAALGLDSLEVRRSSQKSVGAAAVILGEDFDDSVLSR